MSQTKRLSIWTSSHIYQPLCVLFFVPIKLYWYVNYPIVEWIWFSFCSIVGKSIYLRFMRHLHAIRVNYSDRELWRLFSELLNINSWCILQYLKIHCRSWEFNRAKINAWSSGIYSGGMLLSKKYCGYFSTSFVDDAIKLYKHSGIIKFEWFSMTKRWFLFEF